MFIEGIPQNIKETDAATCRSRIFNAIEPLMKQYQMKRFNITIKNQQSEANQNKMENLENKNADDLSTSEKATQYKAMSPIYTFDQLILSNDLKEELLSAVEVIKVQNKVFEEWGLKKIEPFPRTCINFYGPSGTGKTLAAHAIANYLNKQILVASYAEIESKFHGEGPKNVKAIFHAAYKNNNLLFIDEADSLLSKRLTNVTQGSEQAINSMRSQLLICLEQFKGIVIFSTNLVENYDKAFETRVKHIEFKMPDEDCRKKIWEAHFPSELPIKNVDVEKLAKDFSDVCGRDIKNAVIDAAVRSARQNKYTISHVDLEEAIKRIKTARINLDKREPKALTKTEKEETEKKIINHLKNN